jgi:hypothetical protein
MSSQLIVAKRLSGSRFSCELHCKIASVFLLLIAVPFVRIAADDDVNSRLDLFFLNAAEISELSSFSVAQESLASIYGNDDYRRQYSSHGLASNPFARRINSVTTLENKVEGLEPLLLPRYFLENSSREILVKQIDSFGTLQRRDREKGKFNPAVASNSKEVIRLNPCLAAIIEFGAFPERIEAGSKKYFNCKVIEKKSNPDGTVSAVFLGERSANGYEIIFGREPDFLPAVVSARAFKTTQKGPQIAKSADDFRQWHEHSRTVTVWQKVDNLYVPRRINYVLDLEAAQQHHQLSLTFTDWKLGKDVDQEQFKPESMTDEKLKQFDAMGLIERLDKATKDIEDEERRAAKR